MSELREAFELYKENKKKVYEAFDCFSWEAILDQTNVKWYDHGNSISWFEKEERENVQYGYDSAWSEGKPVEGLLLYYIRDNGDSFYTLLDVENRITLEEFYELEN